MIPFRAIFTSSRPLMAAGVQTIRLPKQHEWNRTVSNAEKLVGFPTSVFHLRALMADDVTSMGDHMKKLMGSDHPVLKTIKRLIIQGGQNNMQVRGLMMLLLSRALNRRQASLSTSEDMEQSTGILGRQRQFAEIVEMIWAGLSLHKSVLNLPDDFAENAHDESSNDLRQLEYGNKIAILSGDFLLAKGCVGLADLRNTHIIEMMAVTISKFTQSEFLGMNHDVQGRLLPALIDCCETEWLKRRKMSSAGILADGFKGVAMLANLPEKDVAEAYTMGQNLGISLQAFQELQPFLDGATSTEFDLSYGPVLFHLQTDPELLIEVKKCDGDSDNLDKKKILEAVKSSGAGVEKTLEVCRFHADETFKQIDALPDCDSKDTLANFANYLRQC